jgi:hypothetical protein
MMKKQDIDKIIYDKFIKLLDKKTINNISLLNHDLHGTLIDENNTFNFSKIANEVRSKLDNIKDINNDCFYAVNIDYWIADNSGNLINNEQHEILLKEYESGNDYIYKITSKDILTSLLGFELLDTIY